MQNKSFNRVRFSENPGSHWGFLFAKEKKDIKSEEVKTKNYPVRSLFVRYNLTFIRCEVEF